MVYVQPRMQGLRVVSEIGSEEMNERQEKIDGI